MGDEIVVFLGDKYSHEPHFNDVWFIHEMTLNIFSDLTVPSNDRDTTSVTTNPGLPYGWSILRHI